MASIEHYHGHALLHSYMALQDRIHMLLTSNIPIYETSFKAETAALEEEELANLLIEMSEAVKNDFWRKRTGTYRLDAVDEDFEDFVEDITHKKSVSVDDAYMQALNCFHGLSQFVYDDILQNEAFEDVLGPFQTIECVAGHPH